MTVEIHQKQPHLLGYQKRVHWDNVVGAQLREMGVTNAAINLVRELAVYLLSRSKGVMTAALLLTALPACTVIQGNRQTGAYLLATVGGDVKGIAQTPEGYTAESLENSKSFSELSRAYALKSVASTAGQTFRGVTKAKEATKGAGIAEKGLTDRAGIAAGVEKARIAAEPAAGF